MESDARQLKVFLRYFPILIIIWVANEVITTTTTNILIMMMTTLYRWGMTLQAVLPLQLNLALRLAQQIMMDFSNK